MNSCTNNMTTSATLLAFLTMFAWSTTMALSGAEFSKNHRCQEFLDVELNDRYAPHTMRWFECTNMVPSTYSNTTCPLRCRDPETNQFLPLSSFRQLPVFACESFEVRRNGKIFKESVAIVKGCSCVEAATATSNTYSVMC
ncbi:uncharacterized protein LOC144428101 [Styela clava]